jgi:hypothetical protein
MTGVSPGLEDVYKSQAQTLGYVMKYRTRNGCLRGVLIGLAVILLGLLYAIVNAAASYNGKCGGLIPFLSAAAPCSFWEWFFSDLSFTLSIALYEFWWLIACVIVVPAVAGYLIDGWKRRRAKRSSSDVESAGRP